MLGVEALVGKIRCEEKGFVAGFFDGESQTAIVAVEADEDISRADKEAILATNAKKFYGIE